ncbi:MAG: DNA repair protein RecN [Fimbriimonadales bacterium]|nr:DNA repair protein RecN [Fimbriimonadales bacterium]
MIVELNVENLAVIERASVQLGPGFTVLTGETGAGKSLLVDALELALGGRADSDLVRAGATRAVVSAVFDLTARPDLAELCDDLGYPLEDGLLYVQREVLAEGRSQARLGGRLAPASALRRIGRELVDLHGQHDHQSLLDPETHAGLLDAFAGQPASDALHRVREAWQQAETLRRRLAAVRQSQRDREQRLDMLRFQIAEIEAVAPQAGEMEELAARFERLRHAEHLREATAAALLLVAEGDSPARDALGEALRQAETAVRLDPGAAEAAEALRSALAWADEASSALRAYLDSIDVEPGELERISDRLDDLKRLRRKYGEDEAAVLAFLARARAEREDLESAESAAGTLEADLAAAERSLREACAELSRVRAEAAGRFSEGVTGQLRELAMGKAEFRVDLRPCEPGPGGAESVEFLFTANLGEPCRPLAKIASGGEISRAMLAIKTVGGHAKGVPTLVFDEVDAGLGGRTAAVVARKLTELARARQVIVISHLPQIASRAERHLHVAKEETGDRVRTRVLEPAGDERVREIARMLAGDDLAETALANARDLLSARG